MHDVFVVKRDFPQTVLNTAGFAAISFKGVDGMESMLTGVPSMKTYCHIRISGKLFVRDIKSEHTYVLYKGATNIRIPEREHVRQWLRFENFATACVSHFWNFGIGVPEATLPIRVLASFAKSFPVAISYSPSLVRHQDSDSSCCQ